MDVLCTAVILSIPEGFLQSTLLLLHLLLNVILLKFDKRHAYIFFFFVTL